MIIKKSLLLLAGILALALTSCDKKHDDHDGKGRLTNSGSYITNVHAPTSGSDSITFTADSSQLSLIVFSPLGGTNMVIVRDLSTGSFLFRDTVSTQDKNITGFTPGDNYSVVCYSGSGSPTNFGHASSSYRNSGQTPSP